MSETSELDIDLALRHPKSCFAEKDAVSSRVVLFSVTATLLIAL